MTVSKQAVEELRRAADALPPEAKAEAQVLQSTAMAIGFVVHGLRAAGMSDEEIADEIELVLTAADCDRAELRTARDTLKALKYSPVLITRLTALARRARPAPARRWAGRIAGTPVSSPVRPTSEADLGLALLRKRR